MEGLWFVSYIALWSVVLFQLLFIIALARQIGIMSVRIGPTGARTMNAGPEVGSEAPLIHALDLKGQVIKLGISHNYRTLLVFVSPACSTCAGLVRGLHALQRTESNLDIILVSSSEHDSDEIHAFAEENRVTSLPYVVSTDIGMAYRVQTTPYAVLVDATGIVRSKGLVNHLEHLQSLLNAEEIGHATVESYVDSIQLQAS